MTWKDHDKAHEYVGRVARLAARAAGEAEMVQSLPEVVEGFVDLGCGDGRLIDLVLNARPDVTSAVGVDNSPPMLDMAREHFAEDGRVSIVEHDLAESLPVSGPLDVVVSGFAIHHLEHVRKQSLFVEIASVLRPGGVFANLEVVQCATPDLQEEFHRLIEKPGGDPEDICAPVEPQLEWMRAAGLRDVDCYWRWRGFALLVGRAP